MGRAREEIRRRRFLDEAAEIHHRHPVTKRPHHRQIMRDEEEGEAQARAQFQHQVQHLGLDIHVKGGDRLIGHDQRRIERQCAGNGNALALAAGEFMRKAASPGRVEAHHVEQSGHAFFRRGMAMHPQRLGQDLPHPHARIERGEGVLKHHLQPWPQRAQRLAPQRGDVLTLKADIASIGGMQPGDQPGQGGFAAAAFADNAQALAPRQMQ